MVSSAKSPVSMLDLSAAEQYLNESDGGKLQPERVSPKQLQFEQILEQTSKLVAKESNTDYRTTGQKEAQTMITTNETH